MFSQFSPTGTSTTASIFRSGKTAFGYTTLPTTAAFSNYNLMSNGNSFFSGYLSIGTPFFTWAELNSGVVYGIKSSKSIVVNPGNNITTGSSIEVNSDLVGTVTQIAVALCDGCYAVNAKIGDAVLRGNTDGSLIIANNKNGNIKFESGVKISMLIDNVGNIGIGTGSSPIAATDKLAVNGLIHTKEVKVDLVGWPDYVFATTYKLPTLQDVEKQIQEKGHLANIPSAKEVETNGLLLGDMNKKLLQKVEELTLYLIQQNKEIEDLKVVVKSLAAKNK